MIYMYKVGVVGDEDSILAFKAFGVEVYPVSASNEARNIIDSLAKKDYAVIFITEQIAAGIKETIERYDDQMLPAIILIPSNQGSLNIGISRIKENIEKAVGVNIL